MSDAFDVRLAESVAVSARHYRADSEQSASGRHFVVLAHGAGAGQQHPFIVETATALACRGLDVVTFNFPYIEAGRRLPDRAPVLEACYLAVIETVRSRFGLERDSVVIGGKSMGGRMATHIAAHHASAAGTLGGLVLLGYPLHPPGRPHQPRVAHLPAIASPTLFVQGSEDPFGTPDELRAAIAAMRCEARMVVVEGGGHSFELKGGKRAASAALERVYDEVATWVRSTAASGSGNR